MTSFPKFDIVFFLRKLHFVLHGRKKWVIYDDNLVSEVIKSVM